MTVELAVLRVSKTKFWLAEIATTAVAGFFSGFSTKSDSRSNLHQDSNLNQIFGLNFIFLFVSFHRAVLIQIAFKKALLMQTW